MSPIDDPVIPDDLRDLLRSGSAGLEVAPAEIRSVERRARQRRRRRHGVVAGGAAIVVLLTGLAIAGAVAEDGPEQQQTVIATSPPVTEADSVPQPLLVRKAEVAGRPIDPNLGTGDTLASVTVAGSTDWWTTSPGEWRPVGAYLLADGRRFGVATTSSTGLGIPPKARLDEIGDDTRSLRSTALPLEVPYGSFSASIVPVGATGDEVILQRDVSRQEPRPDGKSFEVITDTTYSAIDVDSGAERPLLAIDGRPTAAAAAGDVLVRSPDADCEIVVSTLTGGDARTLAGACGKAARGMRGRAYQLAVSPDGRYAAVVWSGFDRSTAQPADLLDVIDLEAGSSVGTELLTTERISQMSWTGVHQLTVLSDPGDDPISLHAGPVTVRSLAWDPAEGSSGD